MGYYGNNLSSAENNKYSCIQNNKLEINQVGRRYLHYEITRPPVCNIPKGCY